MAGHSTRAVGLQSSRADNFPGAPAAAVAGSSSQRDAIRESTPFDAQRLEQDDRKTGPGRGVKKGPPSNLPPEATIQPDFSQVESDAFQVQVNQRFPIFFSEKRPFFMEGMGLFNIAGGGTLRTAVHTRRIINPSWGSKLTGTAGKTTFGLLNASDDT